MPGGIKQRHAQPPSQSDPKQPAANLDCRRRVTPAISTNRQHQSQVRLQVLRSGLRQNDRAGGTPAQSLGLSFMQE